MLSTENKTNLNANKSKTNSRCYQQMVYTALKMQKRRKTEVDDSIQMKVVTEKNWDDMKYPWEMIQFETFDRFRFFLFDLSHSILPFNLEETKAFRPDPKSSIEF